MNDELVSLLASEAFELPSMSKAPVAFCDHPLSTS
jgi:hypothetical protein